MTAWLSTYDSCNKYLVCLPRRRDPKDCMLPAWCQAPGSSTNSNTLDSFVYEIASSGQGQLIQDLYAPKREISKGIRAKWDALAVLSLLTALVSLAECKSVQFVLTCLRHCTMVILYAAASSCATRFLSLAAVKASALRNPEVEQLLLELLVTKAWILWSVVHSCADHMGAAITADTMQPEPDEQWVCLQHDGDTLKELLLQEQDGEEREGKDSTRNAAEVMEGAQDTGSYSYSWCLRSAWNDAVVRKALWEDKRPYILAIALSVNAVLILLAALTSLTECNNVQVTLTCLRHSTLAMLYAAAFSCATRFLSLSAVKASVVKKFEVEELLLQLSALKGLILIFAFFACLYHVDAGITVYQKARREENFAWYVQLPADVARVQALSGAIVLSASLIFLMGTDIRATFRAKLPLSREMWEEKRRGAIPKPWRGISKEFAAMAREGITAMARGLLEQIIVTFCASVLMLVFFVLSPDGGAPTGT
ncbi:hypothetical protein HPB52_000652 [Rhipicephalus sanguineus]|uniref:Uncharacterized protein n=1 Tax=Rhipicephalus sanguineus TaxID=34632 RepID=A0A9D4QBE3_RHISA|nr:hypothetical protein HPB52_000652 [Rhipicephalus sanguineus]